MPVDSITTVPVTATSPLADSNSAGQKLGDQEKFSHVLRKSPDAARGNRTAKSTGPRDDARCGTETCPTPNQEQTNSPEVAEEQNQNAANSAGSSDKEPENDTGKLVIDPPSDVFVPEVDGVDVVELAIEASVLVAPVVAVALPEVNVEPTDVETVNLISDVTVEASASKSESRGVEQSASAALQPLVVESAANAELVATQPATAVLGVEAVETAEIAEKVQPIELNTVANTEAASDQGTSQNEAITTATSQTVETPEIAAATENEANTEASTPSPQTKPIENKPTSETSSSARSTPQEAEAADLSSDETRTISSESAESNRTEERKTTSESDDGNSASEEKSSEDQPQRESAPIATEFASTFRDHLQPTATAAETFTVNAAGTQRQLPASAGPEVNRTSRPTVPQVDAQRFLQRVVRAFQAAEERGSEVRLRLSPPELGSLQLELSIRDGVLSARVETETTSARTILLDNISQLRERLAEQGMKIEKFDVDVSGRQPGNNPDMQQQSQDENRRRQFAPGTTRATSDESAPRGIRNGPDSQGLNVLI